MLTRNRVVVHSFHLALYITVNANIIMQARVVLVEKTMVLYKPMTTAVLVANDPEGC